MSRTLLQRTTELSSDLTRLRSLQLSRQESATVEQRVQELRISRERLISPIAFLHAARNLPELPRGDTAGLDASAALRAVERARAAAQSDPDAIIRGSALAPVLTAVRQVTPLAEATATTVWQQIVRMAPTARAELLEVMRRIPSYRQSVEQLQELDREIRPLTVSRWVSPDELGEFLSLRRQAQQLWEELAGTDALPASVLDFLVACAHEGASLDSMTPEISEWIERRNLRGSFRIRFSGG